MADIKKNIAQNQNTIEGELLQMNQRQELLNIKEQDLTHKVHSIEERLTFNVDQIDTLTKHQATLNEALARETKNLETAYAKLQHHVNSNINDFSVKMDSSLLAIKQFELKMVDMHKTTEKSAFSVIENTKDIKQL